MPSPRHQHATFEAPDFAALNADRAKYRNAKLATHTIDSYARSMRVFTAWCKVSGLERLPACEETVELYVTDLLRSGRKLSTVKLHCYAIQHEHRMRELPNPFGPSVKKLLAGATRLLCQMPAQKEALEIKDLRAIVRLVGAKTPIAARNSALLLFGFATALRRSSLARLRPEDVEFTSQGILVTVLHEKQDRKGRGRRIAVPYGRDAGSCPVKMLRRWLKLRGKEPGALFCRVPYGRAQPQKHLKAGRIAEIVQSSVARVGLERRAYGAHSMRAGFVSEALARGANEVAVARQTGHASLDTLRIYERGRDLFRGHAASGIDFL